MSPIVLNGGVIAHGYGGDTTDTTFKIDSTPVTSKYFLHAVSIHEGMHFISMEEHKVYQSSNPDGLFSFIHWRECLSVCLSMRETAYA